MVDCDCEERETTNGRIGTVLRPTRWKTTQLYTQLLNDLDKIKQLGGKIKPTAYLWAFV